MQESGLTEIIPFIWISVVWDQYPESFLSTHGREWLQPNSCQIPVLFSFLVDLEGWSR